jgi:lysophospholipase L1-like esterase
MGILDAPVTPAAIGAVSEASTKGAYASTSARLAALGADAQFGILPAYNSTLGNRTKWRKGLGRVNSGAGNAKILVCGDSTSWGFGAGGPNGYAPPKVLATMLDRQLAPTQYTFAVPPGVNAPTTGQSVDTRWGIGSNWSYSTWGFGGKGSFMASGTSASNALTLTPGANVDTFDVYYMRNTGLGTLSLSVDGGAVTTVDTSSTTLAWGKTTITVAAGSSHVLTITKSVNTVFVFGVDAYLSTNKSIHVMNAGLCSSAAYTDGTGGNVGWGVSPGDAQSLDGIKFIAPDLTIIQLGINDAQLFSNSATNWEAAIRNIITAAQVSGDVILSSVIPSDPAQNGGATATLEQAYQARCLTIAQSTGSTYFDIFGRYGSWTAANALGFMSDALHLTAAGGADVADAYRKLITG